jgi:tryptophan-rich sensory protein
MPGIFREKIIEPLERAAHELRGVAEGAAANEATHQAKHSHASSSYSSAAHSAQKMAEKVLPERLQETLGMKPTTFTGRAFDFVERNVLGRPLVFVAFPLILGLFLSSWTHKRIRTNRAAFDKMAIPRNVPPSWLYDPMWTVALTCMGYASWLIYNQGGFGEWLALSFYNMSLFLLAAWPVLFFGYTDNPILPALCSTLLSINSIITMSLFYAKNSAAGSLMIPAVVWICYMTVLNWQVFSLNKGSVKGLAGIGLGKGKEETWPWSQPAASSTTAGVAAGGDVKKTR